MAQRNAESVLPAPVGATTTVWWPELMASQAPAWAAVGALKLLRNHAAVAGENRSSTSARLPFAIAPRPFPTGPSLPSSADTARERLRRAPHLAARAVQPPGPAPPVEVLQQRDD